MYQEFADGNNVADARREHSSSQLSTASALGLDGVDARRVEVVDRVGDPVDVLFGSENHVGQHTGATRAR